MSKYIETLIHFIDKPVRLPLTFCKVVGVQSKGKRKLPCYGDINNADPISCDECPFSNEYPHETSKELSEHI